MLRTRNSWAINSPEQEVSLLMPSHHSIFEHSNSGLILLSTICHYEAMRIPQLRSGGIITNYNCSSRCRHCLYCSSPERSRDYLAASRAAPLFKALRAAGARSVHIGGGEPFLKPEALAEVIETARQEGLGIDYVETNASWFILGRESGRSVKALERVKSAGAGTLLVSISPFHNEYVPLAKMKSLLSACRSSGISVFPWVEGFLPDLSRFDEMQPHGFDEYIEAFGPNYLKNIASRYWLHPGGRALYTFFDPETAAPPESLPGADRGCGELIETSHYHADLYGRYIPGLCAGLGIDASDLSKGELNREKYPLLHLLYEEGPLALMRYAKEEFGFAPERFYGSTCHLCNEVRAFLALETEGRFYELHPLEYYRELKLQQPP
ncbi:MAG: radical SAM protein [Spirochaetia bacterium]